ncbi:hypothetical protein PSE10B_44420 [Pseudomonas amygdali pv. eriobotryae]|nr:hypothetical protein PSE10B_44420 [Pseudomonas amygdali pv. eriobotryae]
MSLGLEKSPGLPGATLFKVERIVIGYDPYVLLHPVFQRFRLSRKVAVFPLGLGQAVIQKHDRIVLIFWSTFTHP